MPCEKYFNVIAGLNGTFLGNVLFYFPPLQATDWLTNRWVPTQVESHHQTIRGQHELLCQLHRLHGNFSPIPAVNRHQEPSGQCGLCSSCWIKEVKHFVVFWWFYHIVMEADVCPGEATLDSAEIHF